MTRDEIPDRERDCDESIRTPLLIKLMPVIMKMRVLKRKGAKTQFWSRKGAAGLNTKETWVRWEDLNQKLDVISLGVLCDNVSIFKSLELFILTFRWNIVPPCPSQFRPYYGRSQQIRLSYDVHVC